MIVVRAAREEDLAAVLMLERGMVEAPHWTEAQYREILQQTTRCFFVAEMTGEIVGFAVGSAMMAVAAELESVAVRPDWRRAGVGRALCEAVIGWSRAQDAAEMELEVRAGGSGPIALYRSLGFLEVGRRPNYYRDPMEDAVLMRLDLEVSG